MATRHPVRKGIITAAGLGTRFLPITKAQPKEMLPLVDKPIIQYGIEELIACGLEQAVLVTGGGKRAIVDHFDHSIELEHYLSERSQTALLRKVQEVDELSDRIDIAYVQQRQPLGLGHAVWAARRLVEDEACAVLLPDDVILGETPALAQLIAVHQRTGATVLACRRVAKDEVSRYGIIAISSSDGPVHQVVDMVEKPRVEDAPSDLAVFGRYVLTPAVFRALDLGERGAGGEIQLTDAIRRSAKDCPVLAVEFEGDYYDTGTVPGYLKSNLALALKREDLREQMLAVVRDLVDASEMAF